MIRKYLLKYQIFMHSRFSYFIQVVEKWRIGQSHHVAILSLLADFFLYGLMSKYLVYLLSVKTIQQLRNGLIVLSFNEFRHNITLQNFLQLCVKGISTQSSRYTMGIRNCNIYSKFQ